MSETEAPVEETEPTVAETEPTVEAPEPTVEEAVEQAEQVLEDDLARIAGERDEYRALAQRIQADFENYKKRIVKQQTEHLERAAEDLVVKLLPVLDTADLAVAHGGGEAVEHVWMALTDTLSREGLERIDPGGEPFDPTRHEAVVHEPGEGEGEAGPLVTEVLRAGYAWKGRVVRPAMVKVTG